MRCGRRRRRRPPFPSAYGYLALGGRRRRLGPHRGLHVPLPLGRLRHQARRAADAASPRRTRASSLAPLLLGVACLALGLLAPLESTWLMPYAVSFPTGATPEPLALWHGVTRAAAALRSSRSSSASCSSSQREAVARAQARRARPRRRRARLRSHPAGGRPGRRRDDRGDPARLAARSTSRASCSSSSRCPACAAVAGGTIGPRAACGTPRPRPSSAP